MTLVIRVGKVGYNKRGLHYDFLLSPADGEAHSAVEGQKINLTVNALHLPPFPVGPSHKLVGFFQVGDARVLSVPQQFLPGVEIHLSFAVLFS